MGAFEFWRLKDDLRNKFEYSQNWSGDVWKSKMQGGGGNKKRFQYCTDSSGQEILYLRALQGHSGRNPIDPTLQDNVVILDSFFEYIYHIWMCGQFTLYHKFRIDSGRTKFKQGTTDSILYGVNPMDKDHTDPHELHLTKPRLASYKQKKWKRHQDTVYWVDFQLAQRKGLKFYQTRCNAIILYDTLPAYRISKVVVMESGEIVYEKVYVSPRPPPTISFKENWMQELDSEVAGSCKDTQRIQPKPETQLSRTVRPVGGSKSIQSCVSMPVKIEEEDQTRTVRPAGGQEVEELDTDFRVPGLSHAVVKEAEHFRVQELVKKIESHPHREALQADLQQNNVYNPFRNKSKAMIREFGNVELFELCETGPKVECSHCLLYWNQGIVYCICGHFLVESEFRRKFNKLRLDALSIPHYVIKKGATHGARHGKTEVHRYSRSISQRSSLS